MNVVRLFRTNFMYDAEGTAGKMQEVLKARCSPSLCTCCITVRVLAEVMVGEIETHDLFRLSLG